MNDLLLPSGERWSRVAGIARSFAGSEPLDDRHDGSAASETLVRTPAAEGADNLSRISRIVVVKAENRSFDWTLGGLSFTVPVHDFLAEHFTVCDHWHRTVTGSNWPNHTIFSASTAAEVEKAGHRWGVYCTAQTAWPIRPSGRTRALEAHRRVPRLEHLHEVGGDQSGRRSEAHLGSLRLMQFDQTTTGRCHAFAKRRGEENLDFGPDRQKLTNGGLIRIESETPFDPVHAVAR